jgi:hypothetical protein
MMCVGPAVELLERIEDAEDIIRRQVVESVCVAADGCLANVSPALLLAVGHRLFDRKVRQSQVWALAWRASCLALPCCAFACGASVHGAPLGDPACF